MESDIYYDNINFVDKYEFSNNKTDNKRDYLHQEPTQMLLRNYISKYTPYENILLYHELGVGKTCSAITIAEGFKEYINNMGRKVVVLVKNKNIENNFMGELMSKCTGDEYISREERDIYNNTKKYKRSEENREDIINRSKKLIYKSYEFITYGVFINRVLGLKVTSNSQITRKTPKDKIENFNNTVIIVDEAHNITGNDVYTSLMKVLKNSYNYRLVLLTATPIFDNSSEIFELSNLLNANDERLQFSIGKQLFERNYLEKKSSEYINKTGLTGKIYEITDIGKNALKLSLSGKVSYLRSNTDTNPKKIEVGEPLIAGKLGTTKVVLCNMSDYQYNVYLNALRDDRKVDVSDEIKNIESEENIIEKDTGDSKTNSLYKNANDASTMSYPNDKYGRSGFEETFSDINNKILTTILKTELQKYSCKLYKLLQNINQNTTGKIFIYTNYVNYGGTSLLRQLFLKNGFYEYSGGDVQAKAIYKNFIVFDEGTSLNKRERYKKIFNSKENANGDIIRIIIGSPIISEGITLKAVRQVHIIEPYWNMSKINQIIGRAVRNYSHHDLPENERNVEIYKYVSIYDNGGKLNKKSDLKNFFIDKEKYILSEEKDRRNKIVERYLKTISFDCAFNTSRNILKNGIAGSAECDYTDCDYTCEIKPLLGKPDKTTYKMYITFFEEFDIFYVLETLKEMFKKSFVWSLDDIIIYIQESEPLITKETIYTTLSYIVDNKVLIKDIYNRDGFVIISGNYYIFNSSDIDIKTSLYSKIFDFTVDVNKYSLKEYINITTLPESSKKDKDTKQDKDLSGLPKKDKDTSKKDKDTKQGEEMSKEDSDYNTYIEQNYKIYGTFRNKRGYRDDKFRIVDLRSLENLKDLREKPTGKEATSYQISDLRSIAGDLEVDYVERDSKANLINKIRNRLQSISRILK